MTSSSCGRLLAAAMTVAVAFGSAGPAGAASDVIDPEKAVAFVNNVGGDILGEMQDKAKSPDDRKAFFTNLMLENIDFRELGRRVLGRMARKSTDAQREEFYPLFACFFIDTVVDMLQGLELSSYAVGRSKTMPNNEVVVAVQVNKADGTSLDTGWRVVGHGEKLAVVDINVQGASAVGHFRDKMGRSTTQNIVGQIDKLKRDVGGSATMQIVREKMGSS